MIVTQRAYARAGLVGNPSDSYFGKTISVILRNFAATVDVWESPRLEIRPHDRDLSNFESVGGLVDDVERHGYYGGVRLLKAAIKRFADYCAANGGPPLDHNFTIRYHTEIPRLVGMGGSSAIITAAMRALCEFYGVSVPREVLPSLILSVETDELGIQAGLQDRVAQVYEGVVYMDLDRELVDGRGWGDYEPMDPSLLPPLYVAYDARLAEPTERPHRTVRVLYERGDPRVVEVIRQIADLAVLARDCLLAGQPDRLGPLMDRNFDLRCEIFDILPRQRAMVEAARSVGGSAKFAGSGGTIIGTYRDRAMLAMLRERLEAIGCQVIRPQIT